MVTRYVHWARVDQGLELDDTLADLDLAEAFLVSWAVGRAPRTRSTSGRQLTDFIWRRTQVSAGLSQGEHYVTQSHRPYTAAEIPSLFSWASQRPTEHGRRTATLAVTLALGFGLTAADMVQLAPSDFTDEGANGIALTLPSRVLWCDADIEPRLRALLRQYRSEGHLFRARTSDQLTMHLKSMRQRSERPSSLHPDLRRLRVTWFVWRASHLAALKALLRAYGISHLNTLQTLLEHLPDLNDDATRNLHRFKETHHD